MVFSRLFLGALCVAALSAGAAQANEITFNGAPTGTFSTAPWVENGLTLTPSNGQSFYSASGNPGPSLQGSAVSMTFTLTQTAGGAFSFESVDAQIFAGTAPQSTTFYGTQATGGTVSETVTAPGNSAWVTETFPTFSDVTSVSFTFNLVDTDNFVTGAAVPPSVPEPGTLPLFASALAGLVGVAGWTAMRRRRAM